MADTFAYLTGATDFEPTTAYEHLREQCPLYHVTDHQPPFYVVSRFEDVVSVLKQPTLWENHHGPGVFYQEAGVLGSADNPDHARHRRVLQPAFLPTAIARLEPKVAAVADQLFDEILPLGEGDFIELFAAPFPAMVIGELLGVRPEDQDDFQRWSLTAVSALTGGDVAAYEAAKRVHRGLHRGAGHRPRGGTRRRRPGRGRGSAGHRHPGRRQQHPAPRRARRAARAGRDPPPRLPAARRRPRDDDQPHRPVALPAAGAPRADGPAASRPQPHPDRGRGGPALRLAGLRPVPHERGGLPGPGRDDRRRQQAAAAVRLGQPRPGALRDARRVPARSGAERAAPPRGVRLGHPLLHRRAAGPPGDEDHLRAAPRPRWTTSSWPASPAATSPSCCTA